MYVIDELGGFPECAYSLLLSYQSSHLPRGGDQLELVTASLHFILLFLCLATLPSPDLVSLPSFGRIFRGQDQEGNLSSG